MAESPRFPDTLARLIRELNTLPRSWIVIFTAVGTYFCPSVGDASDLSIPSVVGRAPHTITAKELVGLREIGGTMGSGLSVSPDGNYVAFELHQAESSINDYRVAWFVAPTDSRMTAKNVGNGGDSTLFYGRLPSMWNVGHWASEVPKWSPDSRGIAYRKRVDGATQIWWSSKDGSELEQLTHNAADVEEFYWSSDRGEILFAADADREELEALDATRYLGGYVYDFDLPWFTTEGKPAYPKYLLTGGGPRIWVLELASRREHLASEHEQAEYRRLKAGPESPKEAPKARISTTSTDGMSAAWAQPDNPEKQGLEPPITLYASHVVDGSEPFRCEASVCTGILDLTEFFHGGLRWSSGGKEVLFVRKEGASYAERSLYAWRVGDNRVRRVLTTKDWISDCSIVRAMAICFRESPTYPRTIISINLADGSIETVFDPNPEFRNVTLGQVEMFEWKNSLGHWTFGYLVKPPDYVQGRQYPLVFVGYRARRALRGGTGNEYPVHLFAANEFVVLVYDKPEANEAREVYIDPLDLGRVRWGSDYFEPRMSLASFDAAIRILSNDGLIDSTKVAVTGLSAGVSAVNYSLIQSSLFSAAIVSSCEWAPSAYYLDGAAGDFIQEYRRAIGAGPPGSPSGTLWPLLSLSMNAESIETPLLINAGEREQPWALEEVIGLLEHGKAVEMVVHPGEAHIKWQPAHRLAIYRRNVDWLNFWLRSVEDPTPEKVPQYARWHRLRAMTRNRKE